MSPTCGACHEMMPEFEKLSVSLKKVGIFTGRVDCNDEPALHQAYEAYSIPKLLLFRPNKEPLEYQSYRTAKEMAEFVFENMLGKKNVHVLNKEEKLDIFFNESGRLPRMLLISSKSKIPPLFKQVNFNFFFYIDFIRSAIKIEKR
jgi:thiol-disulfide isomerase/thioredoxin